MKRPEQINVLLGCEESQAVAIEFRKRGFNAYSCDLLPCSGGAPEIHLQMDIFEAIDLYPWDAGIFFPPCQHLAVSGAKYFEVKKIDGRQQQGIDFFLSLTRTKIKHTGIENSVGIMSSRYRKPDQIIHPYYFGDSAQKTTCLWLNNLPKLIHSKSIDLFNNKTHVDRGKMYEWNDTKTGKIKRQSDWIYQASMKSFKDGTRSKIRSKTFPGIAAAMAEQWGKYLTETL